MHIIYHILYTLYSIFDNNIDKLNTDKLPVALTALVGSLPLLSLWRASPRPVSKVDGRLCLAIIP